MVKFVDKRIFVLDSKRTNTLCVFGDDGRFITKVSSFGEGPTEYSYLSSFFIDEEKRILTLADYNRAYLRYYDLDTYKYLSCDKFDFYTDCVPLGDDRWAWYMPRGFMTPKRKGYYLKITNRDNETISLLNPTYFVSPHVINSSSHFHIHRQLGNGICNRKVRIHDGRLRRHLFHRIHVPASYGLLETRW